MEFGCSPTATSPVCSSVSASNISTFAPPHSDTNTVLPSGDIRQVYGSTGKSMVFVTSPVFRSIRLSDFANTRTAYSDCPSGETARPPTKVSPSAGGRWNSRPRVTMPAAKPNSFTVFAFAADA